MPHGKIPPERPPLRGVTAAGGGCSKRDSVLRNAEYYVGMLRENGGKSADCLAR